MIKNFDMFGLGINLTINKMTKSKTLIGGFLSIILYLFLVVMFYVSANDVINYFNQTTTVIQEKMANSPKIKLNSTTMPISITFSLGYSNSPVDISKYLNLSVSLIILLILK